MNRFFASLLCLSLALAPAQAEAKKKKKKNKEADYVAGPALPSSRGPLSLDKIMGKDVRTVTGLLGRPVSDVREETSRKLQFTSRDCILDTYFYPPATGKDPVVTFVSARVADGRDAERNSCIASFRP